MNELIWNLFVQTGDVETYLLLKQLENEQQSLDKAESLVIKQTTD